MLYIDHHLKSSILFYLNLHKVYHIILLISIIVLYVVSKFDVDIINLTYTYDKPGIFNSMFSIL